MTTDESYEHHSREREKYSKKVLDSTAAKKLVMAGPGTGKSHLFQEVARSYIAKGKPKIVVLSFINELVKDLTVDMHGLARVSTLHSFAASRLSRSNKKIDMDLLNLIQKDYELETGHAKDFAKIYHEMQTDETAVIDYVTARREYYSCYDPSSMIYDLVRHYSSDEKNIPCFDLILVDEYQDFNKLEIELIRLLSSKSDVIIAGDDDQSLYAFKHAEPDHIRDLHGSEEYEPFELPYCSRSTEVVIGAFHDVVDRAKSEGYIADRISKRFLYYPCREKDDVSAAHPKIELITGMYEVQHAYYVDTYIKKLADRDPKFDVLIICSLKRQGGFKGSLQRLGE